MNIAKPLAKPGASWSKQAAMKTPVCYLEDNIFFSKETVNLLTFPKEIPDWKASFSLQRTQYQRKKPQKQPSRGVVRKRCSENMQQVYRRTPMPKCDFNSNFVEITLGHGCSLQICCIFFEQFFLETPLSSCFWNAKQINHIQRFSCSHQKVLCQKGALINFAKSTKTTCARVSLLIKLEV